MSARALQPTVARLPQLGKSPHSNEDPAQPKIKNTLKQQQQNSLLIA